jgi:hypothetical protein
MGGNEKDVPLRAKPALWERAIPKVLGYSARQLWAFLMSGYNLNMDNENIAKAISDGIEHCLAAFFSKDLQDALEAYIGQLRSSGQWSDDDLRAIKYVITSESNPPNPTGSIEPSLN